MSKSTPVEPSLAPEVLAKYEPVIGLEVHVQLLTRTKIFCGCSTRFGDPPNTNVCPVCLGLPGTLPVLNKRAVEMAMRASLALNCTVHDHSRFARKNYFYPDLPKGYQISQYELPLATGGWLEVEVAGAKKRIGITRLHLEEDAAKNLHEGFSQSATKAYIDYNRCGTPLSEIVSEPDMRTPEETYAYLTTLRQILLYTGVSDCNMEEGSLRCDANVSVRPRGSKEFGTKVEVKNLNSFRFLQKALEFEIERHIAVLESGGRISQETRLWNQAESHTVSMRSKEKAHDYRYFPEPDLLPVHISPAWRDEVRRTLPELPEAKRARFVGVYGITPYDAQVLTTTAASAGFFEDVVSRGVPGKSAANWIQTDFQHHLKESGKEIETSPVSATELAKLIMLTEEDKITTSGAKAVLSKMFETGRSASEIVEADGLAKISDTSTIEQAARDVIAKNPENVAKYRAGHEGVIKFLVGQVMKATRGQANPQLVNQIVEILAKLLGPPGLVAREKYEDVLRHLQLARAWAEHLGVPDPFGRFSQYENNVKELIKARMSQQLPKLVSQTGNVALMWSLVESMELGNLQNNLPTVEPAILAAVLRRALKGPILPTEEDPTSNDARNTMFELALASFLSSAGFVIHLQAETDLAVQLGDLRFGVECKRILSGKRLEERLSDASKQLTRFLDANDNAYGLIAVDVTKLKNLGQNVYEAETAAAMQTGLGDLLETMLRENASSLRKVDDSRIIGLMFHIHTPAFIKRESLLTSAKYYALWPLCPVGSPQSKALEVFAKKIEQRVAQQ